MASFNVLSNYGQNSIEDAHEIELSDGRLTRPTYNNIEMGSVGQIWRNQYGYFGWFAPNMQLQAYGGLRLGSHAALGYFPTISLLTKHWLNGIQLDLNGFDRCFLSASLYEENFQSFVSDPTFGLLGPAKTYAVSALTLSIPWRVDPGVIWVIPNWRRALSQPSLMRFGVRFAYSRNLVW